MPKSACEQAEIKEALRHREADFAPLHGGMKVKNQIASIASLPLARARLRIGNSCRAAHDKSSVSKKKESDLLYDYFGQGQLPRENHDALMTTRAEKKIKREVPVELHMHACCVSLLIFFF